MGRRGGRASFCENGFKNLYIKMFYEKNKDRLAEGRRGAPRRAGRNFYSHAQNVHGTVLGENRDWRRGPPRGAAAASVHFWLFVV